MDDLPALPKLDYLALGLADDFPDGLPAHGTSAFRCGWQRVGAIPAQYRRFGLHWLYRCRHNHLDVAEYRLVGCGFSLRNEQLRGTLESNWLSPAKRFSFLLGSTVPQLISVAMFMIIAALEFALVFGVRFQGSLWLSLLVFLAAIRPFMGWVLPLRVSSSLTREAHAFVFLVRGIVMIFCGITFR